MAKSGLIRRLFGLPANSFDMDETKANQIIEQAQSMVAAYGDVLAKNESGMINDITELPHPKERLKIVLKLLLKLNTGLTMREHLKVAFMSLSTFQPLTEQEKKLVREWNESLAYADPQNESNVAKLSATLLRVGAVVLPLQEKAAAEMTQLRKELEAEGYW